ncbi:phosphatidylserine decarboxylase [Methylobacillus rhizosphaerae]|uniref:Phosphatidylserine decarboxylase proenzyme n=1 Tax=Methylobacillus rhizosphaerae TaxID=551994 RepID=A0A238Y5Z3_9PROT|nr:archaetidylserine decarboxylase [Methylobacillus rhizosphaerae]SNR65759.1 phosphatidylserine decarboxylase [Methylobacillus rhizosphaerae]
MLKPCSVLLQYLLPRTGLTALAGKFAHLRAGKFTTAVIRWFVKRYQVNMLEAANPDITSYATFNEFFTRALKPGIRPLAQAAQVCPVDGAISQVGRIEQNQIFQAKGHQYSTRALLGGNAEMAQTYENGQFATIYLSPRDYHRIHMPCDGQLLSMTYVPGELFSVNPVTAQHIPGLFARNERVICEFENTDGKFALVLVGATIVGSMATVWHGLINPPRPGSIRTWDYRKYKRQLKQGDEMGRFLLGSTVVLLYPAEFQLEFQPDWQPARPVRLGEAMARKQPS